MKILDNAGKVVKSEYNFLLRGGVVLDKENQMDNPCAAWLGEEAWDNITELDKLAGFHGVMDTFEQYPKDWLAWYTHTEPETLPLIGRYRKNGQCPDEYQNFSRMERHLQQFSKNALRSFLTAGQNVVLYLELHREPARKQICRTPGFGY